MQKMKKIFSQVVLVSNSAGCWKNLQIDCCLRFILIRRILVDESVRKAILYSLLRSGNRLHILPGLGFY